MRGGGCGKLTAQSVGRRRALEFDRVIATSSSPPRSPFGHKLLIALLISDMLVRGLKAALNSNGKYKYKVGVQSFLQLAYLTLNIINELKAPEFDVDHLVIGAGDSISMFTQTGPHD